MHLSVSVFAQALIIRWNLSRWRSDSRNLVHTRLFTVHQSQVNHLVAGQRSVVALLSLWGVFNVSPECFKHKHVQTLTSLTDDVNEVNGESEWPEPRQRFNHTTYFSTWVELFVWMWVYWSRWAPSWCCGYFLTLKFLSESLSRFEIIRGNIRLNAAVKPNDIGYCI